MDRDPVAGRGVRPSRSAADRRPAPPEDPETRARELCLRLLTARPRTRAELHRSLTRRGIDEEVVERVLSRFDEVGLIDDAAFAETWVRSRHTHQGLGRRALTAELRRRGVADEVVAAAVSEVDPEAEEERARELVRRRLGSVRGRDQVTAVRRLVGMLARKGYGEGLALRVVRDELRRAGEETDLLDEL
ncbi:regulatory protein RecX [Streptoalloteichus tenebrarius]|uniref:regulatory protein RecX n=1 Tax=Streptoalloteichus tenebrarius (strain ATCC 17920 / DSM 40477 / JCM 4838 / CBS 697.72 / NBRC 16177 / NCIMB 11028 / NRRL B-12390 / A12253. 1 / ISP 5477) TaxID=1933 RepID=UPI0020A56F9E|nr:regulatory protein RecX [Streptoalloteichus tenebrarius]